ncbi:MAG: hypothetical protein QG673_1841 [Pseudomonadota bacterium]|nr:hypothetical protein [Pseudomonadota bacterium]
MSKPIWITIGSLENYEKTDSLKGLMIKFINFCKESGYIKGAAVDLDKFMENNHIGPNQRKMFLGVLELRQYINGNKLIHNPKVIQDNFEFRSNSVAYVIKKYLEEHAA